MTATDISFPVSAGMPTGLPLPADYLGALWRYMSSGRQGTPHRHSELEFSCVLAGSGTYLIGDRRYSLVPGTFVWLFPGQTHVLTDKSADLSMWIGLFRPELIDMLCRTESTRPLREPNPVGQFCRRLSMPQLRNLTRLYEDILDNSASPEEFNAGIALVLARSWRIFLSAAEIPAGYRLHPAVEAALRILKSESDHNSAAEIAARVGLSTSRLSAKFKEETGMTMLDFRNLQRVERYLSLYGTGVETTMLKAALEAGFNSYAQFYRVFREVVGCTPAEYRRQLDH